MKNKVKLPFDKIAHAYTYHMDGESHLIYKMLKRDVDDVKVSETKISSINSKMLGVSQLKQFKADSSEFWLINEDKSQCIEIYTKQWGRDFQEIEEKIKHP